MDRRKFIAAAALSAASTTALTNRADAAVLNPIAARILAKLGWGVLGGIGGYFGNQIARHIESWVIGQWQQPVPAQPPIWWGQNGLGLNGHIPQAPQYWQPQSFLGGWNGPWRHAPPAAPNNFAADVVTTLWLEAETNQIYELRSIGPYWVNVPINPNVRGGMDARGIFWNPHDVSAGMMSFPDFFVFTGGTRGQSTSPRMGRYVYHSLSDGTDWLAGKCLELNGSQWMHTGLRLQRLR